MIIWGFINDIFRSEKDKLNETLERIKANFVEMISLAQENGIEPIVATEITMGPLPGFRELVGSWLGKIRGKTSYQDFVNGHVMQINQWLKAYAGEQRASDPGYSIIAGRRRALCGIKNMSRKTAVMCLSKGMH